MIPSIKLNDGNMMPVIGFGAYLLPDGEECVNTIKTALQTGYRLIDTAAAYTNERSIGKAVRESGVARDEIFLTTKIWVQDYGYEQTLSAIDGALGRLGLDYIDLMLLHRPAGDNIGAYKALEKAKADGKLRSIGVCNHSVNQLKALIDQTDIPPVLDQMECHPLQQEIPLRAYLTDHNIVLESWFPLGHGSKRIFLNETLNTIAQKHGKSLSQIVLKWHIQEGFVVIPKTTNPVHMKENLDIFDFQLDAEDMAAIRALNANRYMAGDPEDPEKLIAYLDVKFEY